MQFVASEDAIIREHYIRKSADQIAVILNRSRSSVISRAKKLMQAEPEFRRTISQRVADRRATSRRKGHLFSGPNKPIIRGDVTTIPEGPRAFNRPPRPVIGPTSEELTEQAVERVERRKVPAKQRRRCSYFHFNADKGRSAQCPEFALPGSAWCPECSERIAELRASA